MTKRLLPILAMTLLLSVMLVACGDETATVPTYSGASTVAIPSSIQSQFQAGLKDQKFKNAKFEAYKTADASDKVKSSLSDGFSKGGWTNKDSDVKTQLGADNVKVIEQAGGFFLGYEKGNKAALIMGFPGIIAGPLGFTDVTDKEVLYMVISGNG